MDDTKRHNQAMAFTPDRPDTLTKLDQFDQQVMGVVNGARMNDYGHPAEHFQISARIKAALRSGYAGADQRHLHVLDMIADKMARLCHSPGHFDSWVDIAGYARTAIMVMDHENQREKCDGQD